MHDIHKKTNFYTNQALTICGIPDITDGCSVRSEINMEET